MSRLCVLLVAATPLFLLALLAAPSNVQAQEQTVCVACHSGQTGRGFKPVEPWKHSIHAANGISCNDCHGGDPKDAANAMNPARGFLGVPKETDIPAFCGRCHIGIKQDFLQSAHGKALGKGGPVCVTCHGSHGVQKASLAIINEALCSRCHTYARAAEIKQAMVTTEQRLSSLSARITALKNEGVDMDTHEKQLFAVRNSYRRLFHEVNIDLVRKESAQIGTQLDKIDRSLQGFTEQRAKRRIAGAFVVGGALLAALFFHLLRKTYE